ncbi:MAG: hypothetical protein ACRCW2_01440, partial [Cellulosilyticaceae bacterium]
MKLKYVLSVSAVITLWGMSLNISAMDRMPISNSITILEGDLGQYENKFVRMEDENYYISKETFYEEGQLKDQGECVEKKLHTWDKQAVDTKKYMYDISNSEYSYCYRIDNLYKRSCTEASCGATQFFSVWKYNKEHSWNGIFCRNMSDTRGCSALRHWTTYKRELMWTNVQGVFSDLD